MRQIGIFQILLSGICFGSLGIFGKEAFAIGFEPGEFLALRFILGALLLFIWLLLRKKSIFLPPRVLLHCFLLGVFGYALFSSLFFTALRGLSASLTVLLLYTYPLMVTIGAHFIFKEKIQRLQLLLLPVVMLGLFFLVWGELKVYETSAIVYGFLAAVFYSFYILASSKFLKGISPEASTFYITLSAGLLLCAIYFRSHTLTVLPLAWGILFKTAFVGTLLAMCLFLAGLQKVSNAEASILSTAEPLTGVLLAIFYLKETLHFSQIIGAFLVLFALLLTGFLQRRVEKQEIKADA